VVGRKTKPLTKYLLIKGLALPNGGEGERQSVLNADKETAKHEF